jgi:hypothetical protein
MTHMVIMRRMHKEVNSMNNYFLTHHCLKLCLRFAQNGLVSVSKSPADILFKS